jgi:hypothetical protein
VSSTSQTGPCWSSPIDTENFHRRLLHRSGRCSTPVRPVKARKPPKPKPDLPSSKMNQIRNSSNTGQQRTHPDVHPRHNPQGLCTDQTDEQHRSDRSGWDAQDEQHPRVNSPKSNSRSPESLHGFEQDFGDSRNTTWALHRQDLVNQNLPKTRGIEEIPLRMPLTLEPRKPQNRAHLLADLGGESKGKEPRRVQAYISHRIPKRKASKSL